MTAEFKVTLEDLAHYQKVLDEWYHEREKAMAKIWSQCLQDLVSMSTIDPHRGREIVDRARNSLPSKDNCPRILDVFRLTTQP